MLNIIITSYKEPKSTIRAINSFLNQNIKEKYKIIVVDPFLEVEKKLKKEFRRQFSEGKLEFFLDPGEGKSYALNIVLEKIYKKNKSNIIILTDGDVYVSKNSVNEILASFKNKKIGCVTGKPVSINSKNNLFGFWSHLLFDGIDKTRKRFSKEGKFFECSGYLFAIRNGVLQGFPLEASEDSIIPYLFWKKNYKIKYVQKAEVFVKNPENWKDWKIQKIRNIKGHENLNKIAIDMPRTKSFFNEIKQGTLFALSYPKNIKELYWTFLLFLARFFIYMSAFYELKFKKKNYDDGWRVKETKSTRTLD
jgi:cellulose synthase/poly-beta-1,6-N-acetylglucosamine synthase-like glycosyltransferase